VIRNHKFSNAASLVLAAAVLALFACGTGGGGPESRTPSFVLDTPSGWTVPYGKVSGTSLETETLDSGDVRVNVVATGLDIRGVFARVKYDASAWHLRDSAPGASFAGTENVFIAVPNKYGVDAGVIFTNADESFGIHGQAYAISLVFSPGADSTRTASLPPTGTANRVILTTCNWEESGDLTVDFHARNIGDYTLDGEVSIPDITPIAINFNESYTSPDDPLAPIDGDSSGEIGVSDITPIALNYQAVLAGYLLQYSTNGGTTFLPDTVAGAPAELNLAYGDVTVFDPWPYFSTVLPASFTGGITGFNPDNDQLRLRAVPHDGAALGQFGVSKQPTGGTPPPPSDLTPPSWDSDVGVISVAQVPDTQALDVTFGSATDIANDPEPNSPPVSYVLYYGLTGVFNPANPGAPAAVYNDAGAGPFTKRVTGLNWSTDYTFLVLARDSAVPPNYTTNQNTANGVVVDDPGSGGDDFQFSNITADFSGDMGEVVTIDASGNLTGAGPVVFEWSDDDPDYGWAFDQIDGATTSSISYVASELQAYEITCTAKIGGNVKDTISVTYTVDGGNRKHFNDAADVPTIPTVLAMPSLNCTSCHQGGSPPGGLNLTGDPQAIYDSLVWVESQTNPGYYRVRPGHPDSILSNVIVERQPFPTHDSLPISPFKFLPVHWVRTGAWYDSSTPPPPGP